MSTTTEVTRAGGALAIRPDQTTWTDAQAAVLQQAGVSDEVTPAELSGFLHLCQRTQLDPFSRQIYLIGRWDNRVKRKVFTAQTAIDGYRVVAHRVVAKSHETFGYEDVQWCDAAGRWRDVWLSNEPPAAAKVTVLRRGERFSAVALFREYVQTNSDGKHIGLWGKMPAGQIAKCAEALALRKAFPYDLAGVYTAEEMAQAENLAPNTEQPQAPQRHLRQVAPEEPDPWQTPEAPTPEVNRTAQELADKAAAAKHRGEARPFWALGKTGRVLEAPIVAPDTKELDQLGFYLTRLLQGLPDAPAAPEDGIPDAEIVPEPDERTTAIADLEAAAKAAGLTPADLNEGFYASNALTIAQAGLGPIREMTTMLRGAA